jgi:Na+-translocating ferredoxin:NAD+ oxidoreductase subunit A
MSWEAIVVTFALVDNVLLSRLLGTVASEDAPLSTRAGLSLAAGVGVLLALATVATWVVQAVVLDPLGVAFLRIPAYVFVVAGLAWLFAEGARRTGIRAGAGFSFPEAALNSAVLGALLLVRGSGATAAQGLLAGLAAGIGYGGVHVVLAGIHRRLEIERVPRLMRGLPLRLVSAGLLAYAFLAFDRAFLARALGG